MGRLTRISKLLFNLFHIMFLYYLITWKPFQNVTHTTYTRFLTDLKHILLWWPIKGISDKGQEQFLKDRCPHFNCYFTTNRTFFNDTRIFDAIVFTAPNLAMKNDNLPKRRSLDQKFIFASETSPDKHPISDSFYDSYFNWTWTYRADSTIQYRFLKIFNLDNDELGTHLKWNPYMLPAKKRLINELSTKTKAAAWFADNCTSHSNREAFVKALQIALSKYNQTLDIFGNCGHKMCRRKNMRPCYWQLKKTYFFYLALEDYIGPDYITAEVLHAVRGNAVPIVYGGADYDKYLPPGSYVNGLKFNVHTIAQYIHESTQDPRKYQDHFRWRNHYRIEEGKVLDPCALCESMNKPNFLRFRLIHNGFRHWWDSRFESKGTRQDERVVRIL